MQAYTVHSTYTLRQRQHIRSRYILHNVSIYMFYVKLRQFIRYSIYRLKVSNITMTDDKFCQWITVSLDHRIIRPLSLFHHYCLIEKELNMTYGECGIHSETICTVQRSYIVSFSLNLQAWKEKFLSKIPIDLVKLGTILGFTKFQIY